MTMMNPKNISSLKRWYFERTVLSSNVTAFFVFSAEKLQYTQERGFCCCCWSCFCFLMIKGWKHVLCRRVKQFGYLDWRRPTTGLVTAFKCLLSCYAEAVPQCSTAITKRGNCRRNLARCKELLRNKDD